MKSNRWVTCKNTGQGNYRENIYLNGCDNNCEKDVLFMRELYSEIEINASEDKIWDILTDFDKYPVWNPFIRELKGDVLKGTKVTVYLQPPGAKSMKFIPAIIKMEKNRELRWMGRFLFPGLFDGEHIFLIQQMSPGKVRFVHKEVFKGLLVPMFWKTIDRDIRKGLEAMNTALKKLAEEK